MIVPLMIWSLSSKLEKLEPSHTRKFPRVNAQNSKLGPIQSWDVKKGQGRGRDEYSSLETQAPDLASKSEGRFSATAGTLQHPP